MIANHLFTQRCKLAWPYCIFATCSPKLGFEDTVLLRGD